MPKVDASDFYMFNSYDTARSGYVTILANYIPVQDPAGGPNFYQFDPDALYEVMIDNDANGKEDVTFQFRFSNTLANGGAGVTLPVGTPAVNVGIPLIAAGPINNPTGASGSGPNNLAGSVGNINENETYTLTVVTGDRRSGTANVIAPPSGVAAFVKPIDNIGAASFPGGYEAYASQYQYGFTMPTIPGTTGCAGTPKVFVGQRAEGFAVNLGTIFDLLGNSATVGGIIEGGTNRAARGYVEPVSKTGNFTTAPTSADTNSLNLGLNSLGYKNVTTIALEIPAACLATSTDASNAGAIIGGWTTASVRQARVINPAGTFATPEKVGGAWTQVSRLSMPLVNEVVIGLKDKDLFNTSSPSGDAQYANYITNPVLPNFVNLIYGSQTAGASLEPQTFPRADLVEVFAQGVPGVNQANPAALWEYQRLNTAIPTKARGLQSSLGALGCFQPNATTGAVEPNLTYVDVANAGTTTGTDNNCDTSGFPNGRRPGDDVVDISLRVALGYLLPRDLAGATTHKNNAGGVPLTDFAINFDTQFGTAWPYLNTPYGGE